jgi:hypothetical protein
MNEANNPAYALVFWLAAMVVAALTAHVALGWLARARRQGSFFDGAPSQLMAAAALGTGVSAAAVLGMMAEDLVFPVGYGVVAAGVLWLGAIICSMVLMLGLAFSPRWWMVLPTASVMAALGVGSQMGWVWAAGLQPGVLWEWPVVAAGWTVMVLGCLVGLSATAMQGSRRYYDSQRFLRRGASFLLGLSLLAGQQITLGAADLSSQKGSVFREQLPATLVGVGCGVLVPLTLVILAVDLSLRNRQRQRSLSNFAPDAPRRHRRRMRQL